MSAMCRSNNKQKKNETSSKNDNSTQDDTIIRQFEKSLFPYVADNVPFVMRSIDKNDVNSCNNNKLLYILGGCNANQTFFNQLQCNDMANSRNFLKNIQFIDKSIIDNNNEIKKLKNNNLQIIGINQGVDMLSFFIYNDVNDGDCIFIMHISNQTIYNIYSLTKDEWLLKQNKVIHFQTYFSISQGRGLLFDQS